MAKYVYDMGAIPVLIPKLPKAELKKRINVHGFYQARPTPGGTRFAGSRVKNLSSPKNKRRGA